jgi:hypothetical protein
VRLQAQRKAIFNCQAFIKQLNMKSLKLIASLIVVMLVYTACTKCELECEPECDLIPAVVIRYDCDRVIFKLLTTENIGDAEWVDSHTGEKHRNVVSFNNTCLIATITNGEKKTLYVNLKKTTHQRNLDCIQCEALSTNPPQTAVEFTEISKSPCEQHPDK